ncbi:transposase [Streptomyces sp. DSM 40750]|uniref:transposase n=1 Tax=Streptomyces sp. DSM 40750 TaxID=2801030 RepID=UPI003FA7B53B
MGLHVDALDTTQRALTLDGQTARAYQRRLWQSRWNPHWRRFRYLRHPRRYREVLGLRYRNSIILGTAEVTAEQWYGREGAQSERNPQREAADPGQVGAVRQQRQHRRSSGAGSTYPGYDGGKSRDGRKRHILTDTEGLLLEVTVTTADVHDSKAAPALLETFTDQPGRLLKYHLRRQTP